MNRTCAFCLQDDNNVETMINPFGCACRLDFHEECFNLYRGRFDRCIYCRNARRDRPGPRLNNDWGNLVIAMNRIIHQHLPTNENIIINYRVQTILNHMNIIQNEILLMRNNNEYQN
jgi:hypothetical protein